MIFRTMGRGTSYELQKTAANTDAHHSNSEKISLGNWENLAWRISFFA